MIIKIIIVLETDMFGLLVSLTYSLPSLFNGESAAPLPSCNIQVVRHFKIDNIIKSEALKSNGKTNEYEHL